MVVVVVADIIAEVTVIAAVMPVATVIMVVIWTPRWLRSLSKALVVMLPLGLVPSILLCINSVVGVTVFPDTIMDKTTRVSRLRSLIVVDTPTVLFVVWRGLLHLSLVAQRRLVTP